MCIRDRENTTRLPVPESLGTASDSFALTADCAFSGGADSESADWAGFFSARASSADATTGSIRAVEMAAPDTTSADPDGFAAVDKRPREPIATTKVTQDVMASKPIRLRCAAWRCSPRDVGTRQAYGARGAPCATSADLPRPRDRRPRPCVLWTCPESNGRWQAPRRT